MLWGLGAGGRAGDGGYGRPRARSAFGCPHIDPPNNIIPLGPACGEAGSSSAVHSPAQEALPGVCRRHCYPLPAAATSIPTASPCIHEVCAYSSSGECACMRVVQPLTASRQHHLQPLLPTTPDPPNRATKAEGASWTISSSSSYISMHAGALWDQGCTRSAAQ